jgi:hypothetical protein
MVSAVASRHPRGGNPLGIALACARGKPAEKQSLPSIKAWVRIARAGASYHAVNVRRPVFSDRAEVGAASGARPPWTHSASAVATAF